MDDAAQPVELLSAAIAADCPAFLEVAGRALLELEPPLTAPQLRALLVLQRRPGVNLAGLAAELHVKSPTATQLCDRLEAAGLIDRQVAGHSRREIRLRLTPGGRRVLASLARYRQRHLEVVLLRLTPAERVALRAGLRAFAAAAVEPPSNNPKASPIA